jgi:hypothetical protein
MDVAAGPPVGAYGLRLEGVDDARPLLVGAETSWPHLAIRRELGRAESKVEWMNDRAAALLLQNAGEIALDRDRAEAVFRLPRPVGTAELVHPLLAPAAAVVGYWLGRESFHAGAFVSAGKAWGLVGDRETGKSTTVAALALKGVPIVCDDMLVLDDVRARAAPRSVDLREESAEQLGVGEALGVVGARERWRLRLDGVEDALPLGGWIFLSWSDDTAVSPVPPSRRLELLHASRGVRVPPHDPAALLELSALPGWEFRRPRRWNDLDDGLNRLLDALA